MNYERGVRYPHPFLIPDKGTNPGNSGKERTLPEHLRRAVHCINPELRVIRSSKDNTIAQRSRAIYAGLTRAAHELSNDESGQILHPQLVRLRTAFTALGYDEFPQELKREAASHEIYKRSLADSEGNRTLVNTEPVVIDSHDARFLSALLKEIGIVFSPMDDSYSISLYHLLWKMRNTAIENNFYGFTATISPQRYCTIAGTAELRLLELPSSPIAEHEPINLVTELQRIISDQLEEKAMHSTDKLNTNIIFTRAHQVLDEHARFAINNPENNEYSNAVSRAQAVVTAFALLVDADLSHENRTIVRSYTAKANKELFLGKHYLSLDRQQRELLSWMLEKTGKFIDPESLEKIYLKGLYSLKPDKEESHASQE